MPMPANVTTVVVLGTFLTPEGTPSTGTITFTPSKWLTNSGADVAIPNSSVTKTLGTAGNFSVTLPVTDDSDLQPANWFYTVSEVIDGVSQSYAILLPGSAATNGTVYLADIAPAAELGPEYASLRGPAGAAATLAIGSTTSVANSGTASVTNVGTNTNGTLNFVLRDGPAGPQGIQGETGSQGPQGSAATISVGTVTAVPYGGTAAVTNVGTSGAAILDFVVVEGPQGSTGPQGPQGEQGPQGTQGSTGPQGETGPQGPQGPAATIEVGTVTAGTAGGTPTVTNSGTSGSAVFDFTLIPGDTGPQGSTGPAGSAATVTVGTVGFVDYPGPGTVTNSGTSSAAVLDFVLVKGPQGELGDLTAAAPLRYIGNEFALNVGTGLETSGTTLAVTYGTASSALGASAAGTVNRAARQDHVHAMPSAADVGAVGTATAVNAGTALAGGGDLSTSRTLNVVLSDSTPSALGVAAAGAGTVPSRSDHVHAMPSAADVGAIGTAALTSSNPAALASAAAPGSSTSVARLDHVHPFPSAANVGAVGTATSITAGTGLAGGGDLSASRTLNVVLSDATPLAVGTPSAGTANSPARADHVHEGTTLSSATPAALGTATAGTATTAARGDHRHAMPTAADVGAVANALVTAAGQVIASSGSATPVAVAAGSADGQVLTWDTASTPKMKWASPASGSDFHPFFFVGV